MQRRTEQEEWLMSGMGCLRLFSSALRRCSIFSVKDRSPSLTSGIRSGHLLSASQRWSRWKCHRSDNSDYFIYCVNLWLPDQHSHIGVWMSDAGERRGSQSVRLFNLFMSGLFNDAVSSSDCVVSDAGTNVPSIRDELWSYVVKTLPSKNHILLCKL
jgi:hypothetical protein